MLYPQEVIEEVRLQNDIVDVISEYVPLKQKGTSYFGLCPFHNEKTPSFSVNREKQFFYCFGCGAAGNVYSFVMQIEHDSFPEAVRRLADRAHMVLPEPEYSQQAKETEAVRQRLFEMHRMAGRFYYEALHQPEGEAARGYLQKRQMQERIQKKFGIGYAPKEGTALCKHLQEKGFSEEELVNGGLALQRKEGKGIYDRFRNRLMFPIFDVQGRVIGFGGRLLRQGEPKYLNSPETMLFHKSRNLYGLNFAKNARKTEIIVVEGYMDMISMYQGGFHNVAAALGTAFNQEHAKALKKYASSVILLYDSDEAGTTAALHAIPILVEHGFRVKVLQVPDGKDPDEYMKQNGAEAFSKLLAKAMPYIAFEILCLQKEYHLEDAEQRVQFTIEAAKKLAKLENDIERTVYIAEVANMTGIAEDAIENEILKGKKREENTFLQQAVEQKQKVSAQKQTGQSVVDKGLLQAQRDILYVCATRRGVYEKCKGVLQREEFLEPVYGSVYVQIGVLYEKSDTVFPAELINYFSLPEEQKLVTEIFAVQVSYENKTVKDIEKELNEELRLLKKAAVDKQINQAAQAGFFDQMQALIENKRILDDLYITISDG